MRIGIIGSGLMGGKLGTLFAHAGHDVVFSDTGPLRMARYTEPFSLLIGQLAYQASNNPALAYRFERFEERG
jgi:3-hydroxyacyl-CoA dehydrogenase